MAKPAQRAFALSVMTTDTDVVSWLQRLEDEERAAGIGAWEPDKPDTRKRKRGRQPRGLPEIEEGSDAMRAHTHAVMAAFTAPGKENILTRKVTPMPSIPEMPAARAREQRAMDNVLAPLDRVAREMELKWGVGRLVTLVPPEWALKFESARQKLNDAIGSRDASVLAEKAGVMIRGWQKLDELATEAGHAPWGSPEVWEVASPGGTVYRIVKDTVAMENLPPVDGATVFTLAEVGRILEAFDADRMTSEIKAAFPGAVVVKAGVPAKAAKAIDPDFEDVPY